MLDILFDGFEGNFLVEKRKSTILKCLDSEYELLSDEKYLDDFVLGNPVYTWDYSTLDEGFLKLAEPFLEQHSWTSALYLAVLEELGLDLSRLVNGCLLCEYSHYAMLINDYYNFHSEFVLHKPDFRKSAALTQLRFTAQYLVNYSSHLLINNTLQIDNDQICGLHRILYNTNTASGISRAVFIKWANKCFENVTRDAYFQNAINSLFNLIIFPFVAAAIVGGRSEKEIQSLKKALSYLALSVKLNTEVRFIEGRLPATNEFTASSFLPLSFPGAWIINNYGVIDKSAFEGKRYVDIVELHKQATVLARERVEVDFITEMNSLKFEYLEKFELEMKNNSIFNHTTGLILDSFAK